MSPARLFASAEGRKRRGRPADLLVVGLGNPGAQYASTRHNLGARVVERCLERLGREARAERGMKARLASVERDGRLVVYALPTTFMNESGESVGALVRRYAVSDWSNLVVVHDELDLEAGVVRIKVGGGTAGHNGLRSIEAHLRTLEFVRVRIGIGRPPHRQAGAAYVLAPARGDEAAVLDESVGRGAEALEAIVANGLIAAMNAINGR